MVLTLKTTQNNLKYEIFMKLCKQMFASIDAKNMRKVLNLRFPLIIILLLILFEPKILK